jgi:hypothetical protein
MNVLSAKFLKSPDFLPQIVGSLLGRRCLRILAYGGSEVPLRFLVRRKGRMLLFHRDFDPVTGEAPFRYCIHVLPATASPKAVWDSGFEPPAGNHAVGAVLAADLEFERRGVATYVGGASLAAALKRSGVA